MKINPGALIGQIIINEDPVEIQRAMHVKSAAVATRAVVIR